MEPFLLKQRWSAPRNSCWLNKCPHGESVLLLTQSGCVWGETFISYLIYTQLNSLMMGRWEMQQQHWRNISVILWWVCRWVTSYLGNSPLHTSLLSLSLSSSLSPLMAVECWSIQIKALGNNKVGVICTQVSKMSPALLLLLLPWGISGDPLSCDQTKFCSR